MGGNIVVGSLLVLLTWAAGTIVALALGATPAALSDPRARLDSILRASLWWGMGVATAIVLGLSLVGPLRSATAGIAFALVAVVMATLSLVLLRRRHRRGIRRFTRPTRSTLAVLGSLALVTLYLAVKALGPVTNYDSGLYHLGAIKYAGDYSTIPGLATLFFPFGYNNAQFPLAAFLGNGPWDGVGYRLANGLIMVLVMADLAIRLLGRRWSWGTFLLLSGIATCFIPLVAIADFWVTSPTSDSAILLLTLVSCAYLADFISLDRERSLSGSVVAVAVLLMICMRPTMLFFGAAAACVVIATTIYRRRESSPGLTRSAWAMVGLLAVLLGAAQAVRDYLLSGWLLYPLSIHAFDVPWRAVDPIGWRTATLVAARDPLSTDAVFTANSWYWIPGWFGRLWSQWETYFFLLGLLVAIVALLLARRRGASLHIRRVLACALPSAVSVLAWFTLSPPSYRFVWGSLFTLFLIPFSAAIAATHARDSGSPAGSGQLRRVVLVSAAVMLLGFTSFSILFRNQVTQITEHRSFTIAGLSLPYAIAPIPVPPTQSVTTSRGLELQVPTESDQCWDVYPLCSFSMGMDIGLRGPSIQDGFLH